MNEVAFRRINGRVVPIRIASSKKNPEQPKVDKNAARKGLTFAAAGVGVSAASGYAYRKINSVATGTSVKAFRVLENIEKPRKFRSASRQLDLGRFARIGKSKELAQKALTAGRRIGAFAAPTRLGGRLFGSILVGIGATKLYEGATKKKLSTESAIALGGGVEAAAFLASGYGGAGFRTATKNLFVKSYPHVRKLKGLLKL